MCINIVMNVIIIVSITATMISSSVTTAPSGGRSGGRRPSSVGEGEVLLRGVGSLRYGLILSENSACQAPICAAAAWWFDNPRQQVVPRSQIPRSTSHLSYSVCCSHRVAERRPLDRGPRAESVQHIARSAWGRCTPHLPAKIIPAKTCWLTTSGKFPVDMRIPPLQTKIILESNPLTNHDISTDHIITLHNAIICDNIIYYIIYSISYYILQYSLLYNSTWNAFQYGIL